MKAKAQSSKGFLISCDKNKQKEALRDATNFITEYIQNIYSDVTQEKILKKLKQDGKEINLQNEIQYQRKKQNKLLKQIETNVNCLVFIQINAEYTQIDPLKVVDQIMKDVHQTGRDITRFCHRILPVERAFRAEHFRMIDQLQELINIHSQTKEIKSWMLNFKCRNNNKFNYKQVLKELTVIMSKYSHFTDIYYPQWTVSVQIINHLMCLSICENFKETNQYKLHKSRSQNEQKQFVQRKKQGKYQIVKKVKQKESKKQQHSQQKLQKVQVGQQKLQAGPQVEQRQKVQKQKLYKESLQPAEDDVDLL